MLAYKDSKTLGNIVTCYEKPTFGIHEGILVEGIWKQFTVSWETDKIKNQAQIETLLLFSPQAWVAVTLKSNNSISRSVSVNCVSHLEARLLKWCTILMTSQKF